MTSVGRGTGVGGLEHTLPEAPKAAPLRAGGSGPGWFSVSGLFPPQPGAVGCSHMLGGRRVGFGECCLFLGMASGFPTFPSLAGAGAAGWGWGQRKLEDISCLTDRTGLINVPKPR